MTVERKSHGAAAAGAPPRFGVAAPRLRALGYHPLAWPRAEISPALQSEALVAVGGTLAVLTLAPIADPLLHERARGALKAHGLLAGPVRVGCDGVESRPLRSTKLWQPIYAALDEAIVLREISLILLDADWHEGTLLDVHHDELPKVPSADEVIQLFREIQALQATLAAERRPQPRPSRKAWIS